MLVTIIAGRWELGRSGRCGLFWGCGLGPCGALVRACAAGDPKGLAAGRAGSGVGILLPNVASFPDLQNVSGLAFWRGPGRTACTGKGYRSAKDQAAGRTPGRGFPS